MIKKILQKLGESFSLIPNTFVNKLKNYHPPKLLALLFLVIPIFISISRALVLDNDFWFLINTGKYIVNHGFPVIEPFTMHQNFSFVAQQWLTDVIFYYINLIFSPWGIVIFTMLMFLLILFISYKLCMLVSEKRFNLSLILTGVIGFLLSLIFIRSRPQLFDFAILLTELYLLESYVRKKNNKYLYFLPLLSILLINLHSSCWLMVFMFMLPYLICSKKFSLLCFKSDGYKLKPLLIALILMLLVGFINPYGIKAITYLFTSYGNPYINELVREMQFPRITDVFGKTIYLSIFGVLLCYLVGKNNTIKTRYFLLFLGTLYLALSSIKGFSYFIVASIFSLGDYLKDSFQVYKEEYNYSFDFKIKYIIIVLFIITLFVGYIGTSYRDFYDTSVNEIVDYLIKVEKIDKSTKIYTDYDTGGYVEYRGFKAYIDPRAEVFSKKNNKKKNIIAEYYKLQNGQLDIEKFLNSYDFEYAIVRDENYLDLYYFKLDKNTSYKKIYTEKTNNMKYYLYKKIK